MLHEVPIILQILSPINRQTLLVTADHSPESVREFERMRYTNPANKLPQGFSKGMGGAGGVRAVNQSGAISSLPSLLVVYDSPTSNKLKCAPVFDVDASGRPKVTGKGR